MLKSYAESLLYISVRIVPLILLGIWISMWMMGRIQPDLGAMPSTRVLGLAIVALFAVLLTLPSLFEIPIALSVLAAGGPVGAAVAILFAGPAINLSSLLVIGRYTSWKVAGGIGGMVWLIAVVGGLSIS